MKHAVVEIRDLAFAWPGHEAVLDLPALRIHEGERVFIKGPSGCGKSTLLGLLAGIQTANHGTLEVLGQPLARLSGRARDQFRAANLGYIFQQFNLLPFLSVQDNVTAALTFSPAKRARLTGSPEQEARRLLAELQLPDEALHRPVHALSIGQQQRAAAARRVIRLLASAPVTTLALTLTLTLEQRIGQCLVALLAAVHDGRLTKG